MPVLLVGDSHLARFGAYPWLVARDCTVRAVGGAPAAELLGQLDGLEPTDFDVIVVSVGTNDCGVRPASLPEFRDAIRAFLARVAPTPVVIVDNPGADDRAPDYDDARMREYAAEAGALVRAAGGQVVDTRRAIAPLGRLGRTADGVHVSKLGHLLLVPALRRGVRRARAAA